MFKKNIYIYKTVNFTFLHLNAQKIDPVYFQCGYLTVT